MNRIKTCTLNILLYSIFLLLALPAISQNGDSLLVSDVIQSKMVIQQKKPFKIWGKAPADAAVTVKADWLDTDVKVTSSPEGKFLAIIAVPKAVAGQQKPTKHTITVTSGNQHTTFDQLLIGDVWFCSGQSNMQFSVKEMADSTEELADANQPAIRLLNVALNFSKKPIDSIQGKWIECTHESAHNFSAVGYTFGKKIQQELNIPIGLIFSGIGAAKVQAYIPQEDLANDSLLNAVYLEPYLQDPKSKKAVDASFSFEKVMRPFLLYNALINPFINLSIKGFCWYQGESNNKERASYTRATIQMIQSWRERFAQGSLPFEFVQIAPYGHEKMDSSLTVDAFFREAQENILALNNTAMVSTMDVGDAKNLHPIHKRVVGERLAAVALNRTYGRLSVPYKGPQYAYVEYNKGKAIIHFDPATTASGLNTNDGKAPMYFTMAGKDQKFYPAEAKITGKTIVLQSSHVQNPVAVRYAFFNYPVTNLQNGAGIPANPFRTDNWPEKKKAQ